MKRNLLSIIFIFCSTVALAGNENAKNNKGNPPQTSVINAADTVVLDLSQEVLTGTSITFPVSILSDDTIFSLDFSFKYNQVDFSYDTITDLTASMQSLSYYNTNDSTVRYTGYSLTSVGNNISLVSVHFTTALDKICSPDFNTIKGYLNGELCSIKLVPCTSSTSSIDDRGNKDLSVKMYPNPVNEILNIVSRENVSITLLNAAGKAIISKIKTSGDEKIQLDLDSIAAGIYFLKIENQNSVSIQKVVLNH